MTVRDGDYILITDTEDERYLQIGEVVETELYDYENSVKYYFVKFGDKEIVKYNCSLADDYKCKVIMFERR